MIRRREWNKSNVFICLYTLGSFANFFCMGLGRVPHFLEQRGPISR